MADLPYRRSVATESHEGVRQSMTKVRTGCLTCKKRRVKCDEAKPACQRCIRSRIRCDGYLPVTKANESRKRTVLLAPHPPRQLLPLSAKCTLFRSPGQGRFQNDIEGHCFHIYIQEIAREICGPFPSTLWMNLIPQISEAEPFVRHAILAIGALSRHSKAQKGLQASPVGAQELDADFHYALKQYGQSLQGMRQAIADGRQNLRKALIACLLVFCFEGMLGNQKAAAAHAESGLKLLPQYVFQRSTKPGEWVRHEGWKAELYEDGILRALNSLDLQVLLFLDHRDQGAHRQMVTYFNAAIASNQSNDFDTFGDASVHWQAVIGRNYHFLKSLQAVDIKNIQEARAATPWEGSANFQVNELLLSDAVDATQSLQQEVAHYQNDIRNWRASSQTLFDEIMAGKEEREKVAVATLRIQTIISSIMLDSTFFVSELSYDALLPEFSTVVSLSKAILPYILSGHKGMAPRFHLDIGVVAALFLVGSRCRFDSLRQEAIEILFSSNLREGIWDALAVAHIARWLREIERQGLALGEPVPLEKRAVLTAVNVDLYRKRAMVGATQRTTDGPAEQKVVLQW